MVQVDLHDAQADAQDAREQLHRFERDGKRFAIDPETCFCFECDAVSWDVLEHYPHTTANRIYHLLKGEHNATELAEVVGELEWLRATKSILKGAQKEELMKAFEVERGLKRVTVALAQEGPDETLRTRRRWFGADSGNAPAVAQEVARHGVTLLLGRAGTQKRLRLEFVTEQTLGDPVLVADLCAYAFKAAQLAGKELTVVVHVSDVALAKRPEALEGHTVGVQLELSDPSSAGAAVRAIARAWGESLGRLAKAVHAGGPAVTARIVVRPNHGAFGEVVETLDKAGFNSIELDVDGAFVAHPDLDPEAMVAGLRASAVYYAQRLLKHHYFRLDPVAPLFWRIYNGTPLRRSDPAGTNELAVDSGGAVYPCRRMLGQDAFRLGCVQDGALDEDALLRFEDVGSLTTQACIRCWARNLCGGGTAAVHHALSGSHREPHGAWCEAQRAWLEGAVAAFQTLSSAGVHFERVYKSLGRQEKPSLFTLARAALSMSIGVRPIEEADAGLLTRWENWNEAAYFVCNETGVLLATAYDREMDSLHPRGIDHELMLIRKDGTPLGLFKIRPERFPGTASAWVYMRDESDYASESVRKSLRAILQEAGGQQSIRRLRVPTSPKEQALQGLLESIGFARTGTQREALYLHGSYHDVTVYSAVLD